MATKLLLIEQLSDEAARDLSASPENWMRFLDTASRVYKYTFPEQLLIYAQRPEATACASMEIWNKKMFRWVKKGSKGIALIDTSGSRNRLRYVFDVADTFKQREVGKDVSLWKLPDNMRESLASYLAEEVSGPVESDDLVEVFDRLARENADIAAGDAFSQIRFFIKDSYLSELDEFNQKKELKDLIADSVWYMLMKRTGLDPMDYLEPSDFQAIRDFNTPDVISGIGTSVHEITMPILMQIGRFVRSEIKREQSALRENAEKLPGTNVQAGVEKENDNRYNEFNTLIRETAEQTDDTKDLKDGRNDDREETNHDERADIQQERGLPDSGSGTHGDDRDDRQVRDVEERVPETAQEDNVRRDDTEEYAGRPSD